MKYKECSLCKSSKPYSDFNKRSSRKLGIVSACKRCSSKRELEYTRTKEGVVLTMYKTQRSSSKRRGHKTPSYTLDELRDWCYSKEDFHFIYDNWVCSNYDRWEKPSIDRIDEELGYTFSNISIMSWRENDRNAKEKIKKGILITSLLKAVNYYDGKMNFIKTFPSQAIASRETGVNSANISKHCTDEIKGIKYNFRYA